MEQQRNALRAGLFMLVSLALILIVIVAVGGSGRLTHRFHTYTVRFNLTDDVGGLRDGDDVRIGGLKVGSVSAIDIGSRYDEARPAVYVSFSVPADYPIKQDAHVQVQTQLTGSSVLNIDDFGRGEALADGQTLRGAPGALARLSQQLASLDLADINDKLKTDLDKAGNTLDNAGALVASVHGKLPEAMDHYHGAVASAVRALDAVHDFLGPGAGDFQSALRHVSGLTDTLDKKAPGLLLKVDGVLTKVDDAVTHATAAMVDAKTTLANARDISASARSIVVGNRSRLEGIILSLKTTSDNLKYASTEIRHAPWRLLYKPGENEVANLNTYDSVRQFAEGANSFDDAAGALRDAAHDPNVKPEQLQKLMRQLDESFGKFQGVEAKLWGEVKE